MSPKDLSDEDKALFRAHMESVKPLNTGRKIAIEKQKTVKLNILQRNKPPFLKSDEPVITDYFEPEFINPVAAESILSWQRYPLPSKQFKQLRQGKIPCQGRVDLHGYTAGQALEALRQFIHSEFSLGHRCIQIIHGKGSRSGEPPILKNLVYHYLKEMSTVLAFHSCPSSQGGNGAMFVLLKRN